MHSHACHCGMCRRWSGSALFVVPVQSVHWDGEEHVQTFRSSEWAERGWCGRCGSSLFFRVAAADPVSGRTAPAGMTLIALGAFDEPDAMPLSTEIYIDAKTEAFTLAGDHTRLRGQEFEASLGIAE